MFIWNRPISAHLALVANKTNTLHITQPPLAQSYVTGLTQDAKFWQTDPVLSYFFANFLLHLRRHGRNCISGLKIDSEIEFSMPHFI